MYKIITGLSPSSPSPPLSPLSSSLLLAEEEDEEAMSSRAVARFVVAGNVLLSVASCRGREAREKGRKREGRKRKKKRRKEGKERTEIEGRDGAGGLTLLKKAYPQFQPRSASELLAVVDANRKTPVSPLFSRGSLNNEIACRGDGVLARAERQGALAPDVRLLDRPAGEERAGYADDAQDDLL